MKWVFFVLALLLAASQSSAQKARAYFVYSDTCPHCTAMKPFVSELEREFGNLTVVRVDVIGDPQKVAELNARYNISVAAVPKFIVGDKIFVGYSKEMQELRYMPAYGGYIGNSKVIREAVSELLAPEKVIQVSEPVAPSSPDIESPFSGLTYASILWLIPLSSLTYPLLSEKVGKRSWLVFFAAFSFSVILSFALLTGGVF